MSGKSKDLRREVAIARMQELIDASGGGGSASVVGLKDALDVRINPSTEETLEAVRVLLLSLDGKDFATESTLATIDAVLDSIKTDTAKLDVDLSTRASESTLNSLLTAFNNEDFSTETTLELVRLLLVSLNAKDFATEATVNSILDYLNTKPQKGTTTHITVPASTSSVSLVPQQDDRVEITLTNNSNKTMWVSFGDTAVLDKGIKLIRDAILIIDTTDEEIFGIWGSGVSGDAVIQHIF